MSLDFDFGKLINALTNNNQAHLPPQDVIRLGVVVGYDPNFDASTGKHSYPLLSITLAGDTNPQHGYRFAENYVPNIGDTVWVLLSGTDGWVMGALAGSEKDIIGQLRSPVALLQSNASTDTTVVPNNGAVTELVGTETATPYLPNRIYRAEAVVTFTVSGVAQVAGNVSSSASGGTVSTTLSGGSVSSSVTWTTPQMLGFRAYGTSGSSTLTWSTQNVTPPSELKTLFNLNGALAIAEVSGTALDASTNITAISSSTTAPTLTINTTLNGTITSGSPDVFLALAQIPPTVSSSLTNPTASSTHTNPSVASSFSNSTQNSEVSIGVMTPAGYQEMTRYDVTGAKNGQQFTVSASTTYWDIPNAAITPGSWQPNFTWEIAMQSVGTTKPTITNVSQKFFIYDCGVAS